jgi:outer membrane translocation and assembly module TamA
MIGNGMMKMLVKTLTRLAIALLMLNGQTTLAQQSEEPPDHDTLCALSQPPNLRSEVTVAELNLEGDLQLPSADQEQIASQLKEGTYPGEPDGVTEELEERVRQAWQNRGYFKVRVQGGSHILSSIPGNAQIAATFHIEEGPRYRLQQITFKGNKAIANIKALRDLFPSKDGDVFNRAAIGKGLENLGKAYSQFGYINFTSVPETKFNEADQTISLVIDIDEGKQFYIGSIRVFGADPQILSDLPLKRGQPYNGSLIEAFLRKHLPEADPNDQRVQRRVLNERAGTVGLVFDLRDCGAN